MTPEIFVSYANEDISIATELVRVLETEGWSVWWDREIVAGRDFELEIDQALATSKVVIVLWSSFSVASNWVRNEAMEAKNHNKLIPILLDDARIPLSFRSLNTIELLDWPSKQSTIEINSLLTSVSRSLNNEQPIQSLERAQRPDNMSLSVRVATRVADMMSSDSQRETALSNSLSLVEIERCISNFSFGLITKPESEKEESLQLFVAALGELLAADTIVQSQTDLESTSVLLRNFSNHSLASEASQKAVRQHINDFLIPDGNGGLYWNFELWKDNGFLCLELPAKDCSIEHIWFLDKQTDLEWNLILQERLTLVANCLAKLAARGESHA